MISGKKKENLGLLEVGTIDIPILSLPERQLPALGPYRVHPLLLLLFQVRPPVRPAHAAELADSPESLTTVKQRWLPLGSSRGTREIPKRQDSSRSSTSMPVPGRESLPS